MRTALFTIVSSNYRHYARVLMAAAQRHHPEWERFVLLVGATDAAEHDEAFTTVRVESLPLPHARQFFFRYTILELNTAVKPWMFEHLFARGYDRVIYLDPDIVIYSPLVELDDAHFITVTPHLTGSIESDAHPSEQTILQAGAYNLGFLAVTRGPELERFLGWWQEKLEFQCVVDTAQGLFVDQKWIDLVPGMFSDVAILRHDGYNVAYWNLRQRTVVGEAPNVTVNGAPLRFFHFSGVDPDTPDMVSRHDRLRSIDVGDARKLVEDYTVAVRAAGHDSFRRAPYAYATFNDGTRVSDAARVAYRNSDALQSDAGDDPFAHPELFRSFVEAPRTRRAVASVGRRAYNLLSRARPLVRLIPRSVRTTLRDFLLGHRRSARVAVRPEALRQGLNIVGYLTRDTGVGESARLCRKACSAAEIPTQLIDVDATGAQDAHYRATIFHVNADQTPVVYEALPQVFNSGTYNIGCWHWELPELPDAWIASAGPLDEIWAPSAFIQSAVSRKVTIPVVHMPHGIDVTNIDPCSPEELGVPAGRFTFLCMFDLDSVVHRKNPWGAVEAFRRAFPAEAPVALVVKSGRSENHREEYAMLQERLATMPNVYLTDRMLPRARVNGLIAGCDAILSLHRSEGFGLILAEAMYLGKPVVATGWSGNMDFMNSGNSCPVAYELVTLDRSYGYYTAGQQWAEPDLEHAAHLMRRIVDDAAYRAEVSARAKETMRTQFSPAAAGQRYRRRLAFLGLLDE